MIYKKLQNARKHIQESNLKKAGRNDYSQYDYYTPEQVESLVTSVIEKEGLICICNLKADEYGLYQELELLEIETPKEKLVFQLRTQIGSMKATNETQQMGGTDTYSERYIKMKVFQIKDNNLDFDSQDGKKLENVDSGNKEIDDLDL